MYTDDDLIPISALQHAMFCERQYALIHLEQMWEENRFTAEGNVLHERVHNEHSQSRKTFREEYSMSVRSLEYGLTGKCDLVELWIDAKNKRPIKINPVEFKRGRTKENDVDRVQLCAQAICLEEMFHIPIVQAQLYYLQEHRRKDITIDENLRHTTIELTQKIREIRDSNQTPTALYEKRKCDHCSLVDMCMPQWTQKSVSRYIKYQVSSIDQQCENY